MILTAVFLVFFAAFAYLCEKAVSFSATMLADAIKAKEAEEWSPFLPQIFIPERRKIGHEFRAEQHVTLEMLQHARLPEGYVERQIAERMIRELPLSEVEALFGIDVISPYERIGPDTPYERIREIHEMQHRRAVAYRASLTIYHDA
jgi:hypothetical protein